MSPLDDLIVELASKPNAETWTNPNALRGKPSDEQRESFRAVGRAEK